jgi:hypothetical protein
MSGGLRRFAVAPGPPPPDQRLAPAAPPVERCEMCGEQVPPEHSHVVDIEQRSLMCACRACYLLFTQATTGRYRAVPDRYLADPDHPLTQAEWDSLGIPVGSAFVLPGADGPAAFYPSPAGATECLLDLSAWAGLAESHPLLAQAEQDVEAILLHNEDGAISCHLVPVDACYQLVGTVRVYWQGFDGGAEARDHIHRFFDDVARRAKPVGA